MPWCGRTTLWHTLCEILGICLNIWEGPRWAGIVVTERLWDFFVNHGQIFGSSFSIRPLSDVRDSVSWRSGQAKLLLFICMLGWLPRSRLTEVEKREETECDRNEKSDSVSLSEVGALNTPSQLYLLCTRLKIVPSPSSYYLFFSRLILVVCLDSFNDCHLFQKNHLVSVGDYLSCDAHVSRRWQKQSLRYINELSLSNRNSELITYGKVKWTSWH